MSAEAPEPTEILTEPFEGLDIYSPDEQLAMAEIWQEILDLDDHGSVEEQHLAYQMERVEDYLGEYYPGYESSVDKALGELDDEAKEIGYTGEVKGENIISDKADQARWRLSSIDPSELAENRKDGATKKSIEQAWRNAAEQRRKVRIANLDFTIAELEVERELAETGGQFDDDQGDDFRSSVKELVREKRKLEKPSGGNGVGWGTGGVPTRG